MNVDLNLYIGLPALPRLRNQELGSDLALGSLPVEEISASAGSYAAAVEPLILQVPYSPSNALFVPEFLPADPLRASDDLPTLEYSPQLPLDEPTSVSYVSEESPVLDVPYSPRVHHDEALALGRNTQVPSDQEAPLRISAIPLSHDADSSTSYSISSNPPSSRIPHRHNQTETAPFGINLLIGTGELIVQGYGSSPTQDPRQFPEYRIQRLLELLQAQRDRSSHPYDGEVSDPDAFSLTNPEILMQNIVRSQRALDATRKNARDPERPNSEGSCKQKEENSESANFECNICFETSKEPVVTPCGHLFCWPCLYKWLYAHSKHSECPVCKGEVLEVNLTPIYGRGGTYSALEMQCGEDGKIPPRPHANRVGSMREQLQGPILRRWQEAIASWRHHYLDEDVSVAGVEGQRESSSQGRLDNAQTRFPVGVPRARRIQLEEGSGSNIAGASVPANARSNLQHAATAAVQERVDLQNSRSSTSGLPEMHDNDINQPGSSTSLALHHTVHRLQRSIFRIRTTLDADQTSVSSTMAVIQGDGTATRNSSEVGRTGSSRTSNRRGRSTNSGSVDVDGEETSRTRGRLS